MSRHRVLSFMSQWGGHNSRAGNTDPEPIATPQESPSPKDALSPTRPADLDITAARSRPASIAHTPTSPRSPSIPSRARGDSRVSQRNSIIQTYQPPQVEVASDTPPELAPIFTYLNSHSNKLYQEGYFLKLHDLDSRGRPSADRVWNECFAQLIGTVLSLWDAAALDAAGEDGEVVPTFINLSDASLKMIESLPMNGTQSGTLQNVLSISTAANNRYLLHFNSLNSLTQWTAGIRLAMFEHSALQEAYTGSLIAGKGKFLNNVRQIMERSRFVYEDWARVRFGAGTPWKRCWCVITPPDEKEFAKAQKLAKKNPYERMRMPKGDVRFYDTRKVTKKTRPLATISDAYAAYAIYPQAKPLIDQSTLVKVEGLITQHTKPEKTTEGFVFVMPEVHPAVSGFEMMLRWLFPVFDTFALYGRPTRLIADVIDQRGLMFAMPRDRRYGFLDTLDVSGLIHTTGSQNWSERQWRNEMKKLTSTRMAAMMEGSPRPSQQISQRRATTSRQSLPPNRMSLRFDDNVTHSSPGSRSGSPAGASRGPAPGSLDRTDSAPPTASSGPHKRSASDVYAYRKRATDTPSRLSQEIPRDDDYGDAPRPPPHGMSSDPSLAETYNSGAVSPVGPDGRMSVYGSYEKSAQSADHRHSNIPLPVHSPPPFAHAPSDRPSGNLNQASDLRRAHAAVDEDTLYQMQDARQTGISPVEDDAYTASQPSGQQQAFLPYRSRENTIQQPSYHQNNSYNGGYDSYEPRDRVQRLSTIPGSPFVGEDTEYFARTPVQQHMPPLSENGSMSHHSTGAHTPDAQSPSAGSRASIARKPVPRLASEAPDEYSGRYGNNQNPQNAS